MRDWRAYVREHLPALKVRAEREDEIVAELALQLEQAYAEALAGGAQPPEALARAEAQLGDWRALAREIEAAERPVPPPEPDRPAGVFSGAAHDLRYALRFLRRNPVFLTIAALTLAFGIGGNTAVFTMVDALLLRSLPYPQPDRLMALETRKVQQPEIEPWTSPPDFFDIRERSRSFSEVAGIDPVWNMILFGRGEPEQLQCLFVSANFFPMLGLKAELGRTFAAEEDDRARPKSVVLLSHAYWQRRFGGTGDVLGQKLTLDGGVFTVIGVMPEDFRYAGEPLAGTASEISVYLPLAANPLTTGPRGLRCLKVIGRLKPGVSSAQAREEVRSLGAAMAGQYPESNRGFSMDGQPLRAQVAGRFRLTLMLLLGTVGFVLLMACANVANMLLARAAARTREISVRVALGASQFRLLRQLLTEGFALALAGGVLGLALAMLLLRFLSAVGPASLVRTHKIALDGRALLFTAAAVVACTLLAGLPPAWRMARADLAAALREAGRGLTGGHHRLRSALVVVQVAVALVLLVGAGLLIRSFDRLLDINPGFDARNLVTISTQVPTTSRAPEQRKAMYELMRDRLRSVPGVLDVAAASRLPMGGMNLGSALFIEGKSTPGEQGPDVEYRVATPNYFATMGIPLRSGRVFDERDDAAPAGVVIVNQTAARRFWPGEDAVGKRIKLGPSPERQAWITIVGVVGDVRHFGLDIEPRPEIYRPYAQNPLNSPILVIRTGVDPSSMSGAVAAKVRSVHPDVPAYNVYVMQELVDRSTAQRRFVMLLLSGFAVAALLLAAVGIYGTVSQSVAQRTPEIGLRMALGASPGAALGLVFRQGLQLAVAGIAIGSVAAAGLTRVMGNLLFEVRPLDPVAFSAAAGVLAGIAALACYVPARRATRVDPLVALREG
jgi:predicted permease